MHNTITASTSSIAGTGVDDPRLIEVLNESCGFVLETLHSAPLTATLKNHQVYRFTSSKCPMYYAWISSASFRGDSIIENAEDVDTFPKNIENKINKKRLELFKEKHTQILLNIIAEQTFEYGFYSKADLYIRELTKQNATVTKEWLNTMFLDNYAKNPKIVIGLMQAISHMEYSDIYPQGQTMAMSALLHTDAEVRECGIRAFENWEATDAVPILKTIKCEELWLQEYLDKVIADLEEE